MLRMTLSRGSIWKTWDPMVARASQAAAWIRGSFMFCRAETKAASPNIETQMSLTSAREMRRGEEEKEEEKELVMEDWLEDNSNSVRRDRPNSSSNLALKRGINDAK